RSARPRVAAAVSRRRLRRDLLGARARACRRLPAADGGAAPRLRAGRPPRALRTAPLLLRLLHRSHPPPLLRLPHLPLPRLRSPPAARGCHFYPPVRFRIRRREIRFYWINNGRRRVRGRILTRLINAWPLFYERFLCWMLPANEIYFVLEPAPPERARGR